MNENGQGNGVPKQSNGAFGAKGFCLIPHTHTEPCMVRSNTGQRNREMKNMVLQLTAVFFTVLLGTGFGGPSFAQEIEAESQQLAEPVAPDTDAQNVEEQATEQGTENTAADETVSLSEKLQVPVYPLSQIRVVYADQADGATAAGAVPAQDTDETGTPEKASQERPDLCDLNLVLTNRLGAWGKPQQGDAKHAKTVGKIVARPGYWTASALQNMREQIAGQLIARGIFAAVDLDQTLLKEDPDLLPTDAGEIVLTVRTGKAAIDNQILTLERFTINYLQPLEGQPPVESLAAIPLRLSRVEDVYVRYRPGLNYLNFSLDWMTTGGVVRRFDTDAIRSINEQIRDHLNNNEGIVGVMVLPAIPPGADLEQIKELNLQVFTAFVANAKTRAFGERIPDANEAENHPLHEKILADSPLQPGEAVISKRKLDEYLYRLNRHPGRRVDAAIVPRQGEGDVDLEYLVRENKPWYAYFQLSDTGTDETEQLRERFGFVHNQLTNADDILTLDYVTANFQDSHSVYLNYERPLNQKLSASIGGYFNRFEASEFGFDNFIGQQWAVESQLSYNLMQSGSFFLDAIGKLSWTDVYTDNQLAATEGEEAFLLGRVGLEASRTSQISTFWAQAGVQGNLNEGNPTEMVELGRTNPDTNWVTLDWNMTYSFYLEPLLNRSAWENYSDPDWSTLSHEILFRGRGQFAFDDARLVPQFSGVAGGLYSVRGYDEGTASGDELTVLSAEYRFHIPRVLPIGEAVKDPIFGQTFRATPEAPYGAADWDLIAKAFVDAAWVSQNRPEIFETNEEMLSTGVGLEFSLKNNLRAQVDLGWALKDAGDTEEGDTELHFAITLLY